MTLKGGVRQVVENSQGAAGTERADERNTELKSGRGRLGSHPEEAGRARR
jgi:hypothetical protein